MPSRDGTPGPRLASVRLVFHLHHDHGDVSISKVTDLPYQPSLRRFGHREVDIGIRELQGLNEQQVVALLARALAEAFPLEP